MEAQYKTINGKLIFKVTGETNTEIFSQVAMIQEIFEAESKCGKCGCQELRFVHRVAQQEYDYYELRCTNLDCNARFDFGQRKGTLELYPKRRDESGAWLPNGGWYVFESQTESAPIPPPSAPRQAAPPPQRQPPPQQRQPGPQPPPPQQRQAPPAGNAHSASDLPYDQSAPPRSGGRRY